MQKVCNYFEVGANYFLDGETLINEEQTNNDVVYNKGIFNNFPEELLKKIVNNQELITQLLETQNKLIEKLLTN